MGAGDGITLLDRDPHGASIGTITRLYVHKTLDADDIAMASSAIRIAALPDSWKAHIRQRLAMA